MAGGQAYGALGGGVTPTYPVGDYVASWGIWGQVGRTGNLWVTSSDGSILFTNPHANNTRLFDIKINGNHIPTVWEIIGDDFIGVLENAGQEGTWQVYLKPQGRGKLLVGTGASVVALPPGSPGEYLTPTNDEEIPCGLEWKGLPGGGEPPGEGESWPYPLPPDEPAWWVYDFDLDEEENVIGMRWLESAGQGSVSYTYKFNPEALHDSWAVAKPDDPALGGFLAWHTPTGFIDFSHLTYVQGTEDTQYVATWNGTDVELFPKPELDYSGFFGYDAEQQAFFWQKILSKFPNTFGVVLCVQDDAGGHLQVLAAPAAPAFLQWNGEAFTWFPIT